jgi:hypothetical protein
MATRIERIVIIARPFASTHRVALPIDCNHFDKSGVHLLSFELAPTRAAKLPPQLY